jgi:23S rRNA (pseudouridine1915-N3)-methyltransferase
MKMTVASVGRLKAGPLRTLAMDYAEAAGNFGRKIGLGPLTMTEIVESRAASADLRRADEASRLLKSCRPDDRRVVLSENGRMLASTAFAQWIAVLRDGGATRLVFMIGGPDGHGADAQAQADLVLSLSPMTLPHGLARIMLLEQIYRAATLLAGHPYHRGLSPDM